MNSRSGKILTTVLIILAIFVTFIAHDPVVKLVAKTGLLKYRQAALEEVDSEVLYADQIAEIQKEEEALKREKVKTKGLQANIRITENKLAEVTAKLAKNETDLLKAKSILNNNGELDGHSYNIVKIRNGMKNCIDFIIPRHLSDIKHYNELLQEYKRQYNENQELIQKKEIEIENRLASLELDMAKIKHQETREELLTFVDSFSVRFNRQKAEQSVATKEWKRRVAMAEIDSEETFATTLDDNILWNDYTTEPKEEEQEALIARVDAYFNNSADTATDIPVTVVSDEK